MGSISYDGRVVVVDDRTLTHLQIVIAPTDGGGRDRTTATRVRASAELSS